MGRGGGRIKEIRAVGSTRFIGQRRSSRSVARATSPWWGRSSRRTWRTTSTARCPRITAGPRSGFSRGAAGRGRLGSIEQAGSRGGALGASATVGIVAGTAVGVGGGSGAAHLAGRGDGVAPTSAVFGSLTGGVYGNGHAAVGQAMMRFRQRKTQRDPTAGG